MSGKPCRLALEDGTMFEGRSLGATGERYGEVVFNTSMTGYQEILTDPSYAGQIITMTYPLIGNYGVNEEDTESRRLFAEGFVVRESSRVASNWRSTGDLHDYLAGAGVVGIEGIDTRALTRHIRSAGAMKGVISSEDGDRDSLVGKARGSAGIVGRDLVREVTVGEPYVFGGGGAGRPGGAERGDGVFHVVAYDYGIKRHILESLEGRGCRVMVVPASTTADEVLAIDPDGVFLSNGPGDPEPLTYAASAIRQLVGNKPVFGICLGHQLLSLALGGKTYKLKFGHRGANHPVKNLTSGRVEITSQNHGFAVDAESLGVSSRSWRVGEAVERGGWSGASRDFGRIEITHLNLNDGTVEGLRCLDVPAFSVQYHPESSPGPHDSGYLFDEFIAMMAAARADVARTPAGGGGGA